MGKLSEALLSAASRYQSSEHGIALEDFVRIPATSALTDLVADGLVSSDPTDRRISLFFCEGFLFAGSIGRLGERLPRVLPSAARRLLRDENALVRAAAYAILPYLRFEITDFREIVLAGLRDPDAQVRIYSLNMAGALLRDDEVKLLFDFKTDGYIAEISPNGPLHYVLRNQAFLLIEKRIGRTVPKREFVEMRDNEPVFWWDWEPLLALYPYSKRTLWQRFFGRIRPL